MLSSHISLCIVWYHLSKSILDLLRRKTLDWGGKGGKGGGNEGVPKMVLARLNIFL
jgi:hypothetical protein